MNFIELFIIAVGLSMDAFAVAICKGLSLARLSLKKALIVGLYFGIFQAIMPLLGYLVGTQFAPLIEAYDHWVCFVLLALIGLKMIKESFDKVEEGGACEEDALKASKMLVLALATSVDALAVGISFALIQVQIVPAVTLIGVTTLLLSMLGVKIGNVFGSRFKSKAEFAGGALLVLMGVKILLEHLGILPI